MIKSLIEKALFEAHSSDKPKSIVITPEAIEDHSKLLILRK